MTILGVDFTEMAKPATLYHSENEHGIVFEMRLEDKVYRHILPHLELLSLSTNELIIECITKIIQGGRHRLLNNICEEPPTSS